MRNFKGRLITMLIVFFAGFATAIYGLAPVDRISEQDGTEQVVFSSFTKSDVFANDCGRVLKNWARLAEDAAVNLGWEIENKIAAKEISSNSITDTQSIKSVNGGSDE